MTADDTVTIPRELAESLAKPGHRESDKEQLRAILNPPPEFDPEMVEAMAEEAFETYIDGRLSWASSDSAHALWHRMTHNSLTAARSAGWEMVRAVELEALREFTALLFEGEEPELTDDELAYGIYFSDHLTDAQFYAPLSSAQRDAIRQAKAARRSLGGEGNSDE